MPTADSSQIVIPYRVGFRQSERAFPRTAAKSIAYELDARGGRSNGLPLFGLFNFKLLPNQYKEFVDRGRQIQGGHEDFAARVFCLRAASLPPRHASAG